MTDFTAARANMVESQIRPNKVTDPALILALATLPREQFVPIERRSLAYVDEDLSLGDGRYLMEPMVLARLIQIAAPQPEDIAMVLACGTGYAVAVLAQLCETVIGIESNPDLVERSSSTLVNLGIDNAMIFQGAPQNGYPKQAPYNVTLFDGGISAIPDTIMSQCAEGGRIVGVVKSSSPMGRATLATSFGGVISTREMFDAQIPMLPELVREEAFSF